MSIQEVIEKEISNYSIDKEFIRSKIKLRYHQENGCRIGLYSIINSYKKFDFEIGNKKKREKAKKEAIYTLKRYEWRKKVVQDFPVITDEMYLLSISVDYIRLFKIIEDVKYVEIEEKKLIRKYSYQNFDLFKKKMSLKFNKDFSRFRNYGFTGMANNINQLLNDRMKSCLNLVLEDGSFDFRAGGRGRKRNVRKSLRDKVFARDNNSCVNCKNKTNLVLDHIYPVTYGGPGELWNLQILCRDCNHQKLSRFDSKELNRAFVRLQSYSS